MATSTFADVLVVGAPATLGWINDVAAKITASGRVPGNVDTFDASAGTPTLQQLQQYDAALVFSDRGFSNPTALGDVIADYCDSGGGVVQCTFSWHNSIPLAGRWASGGYSPLTYASQAQGVELTIGTRHVPNHPVLQSVAAFSGGTSSYHNTGTVAPNAVRIADWTNNAPLVAEMPGFNGGIIGLNFYPPSSDARSDFWRSDTDGDMLMGNALAYVSGAGCVYVVKKSKAKGGCGACPNRGDDLRTQTECEDIQDCDKKIKTIIACPGGGNGTCKLKGKRKSCGN